MKKKLLLLLSIVISNPVMASVQLSKTRIIIHEDIGSGSISAENKDPRPYVLQSWVEGQKKEMDTPFFITPPLSRLNSGSKRAFTIKLVGNDLPTDRESLYWFNMLEIPPKGEATGNSLTLAVQSSLKIIYRPTSIKDIDQSDGDVDWSITKENNNCFLNGENKSPYIMNYAYIYLNNEKIKPKQNEIGMPFSTIKFKLNNCQQSPSNQVKVTIVNDYGGLSSWPDKEATFLN